MHNPYIAGKALGQERGFFGREDILRLVESSLGLPDQSAIVLFGQRRIGKTSILLQLQRRLPAPPFLTVYFDLMDCARLPLGEVLFRLAATISAEAGLPPPEPGQFDDMGRFFRRSFLPALYAALGDGRSPVLLLDEFDVLDVAAEELPDTAAAQAFFPYLRGLLEGEPRLKFVFVIGRRAEDLSINVKATFKTSLYKRVSVLDEPTARALIGAAERQGTLHIDERAQQRILALTSGHPYLTQLLCQILWNDAYVTAPADAPTVGPDQIEAAALKVLELGQHVFEWIWDGLPPAERVIFAAIADATDEQSVVTHDQLTQVLQSHGVRILTRQLELAPETLVEWEMLCKGDQGYRFFIELLRRWVVRYKPLPKVKEEIDRIEPQADLLYRSADSFYRQDDIESAQDLLRRALRVNPNHLKARLLLGQSLLDQVASEQSLLSAERLAEAIRVLEEAYRYDEGAARYPLIRALLARGELGERAARSDDALADYERVLAILPSEQVAQERYAAIWTQRGDEAVKADNLTAALAAYQRAGDREKVALIETLHRQRQIESLIAEAQGHEKFGEWDSVITIYQQLIDQHGPVQKWLAALEQAKTEQELERLYAEGTRAFEIGNWTVAAHSLVDVIKIQFDYNNAADILATCVENLRATRNTSTSHDDLNKQDSNINSFNNSQYPEVSTNLRVIIISLMISLIMAIVITMITAI